MRIPFEFYCKDILSFIDYLITCEGAQDFQSLDEIHKDKLTALGIKTLKYDLDVIFNDASKVNVVNYLLSYDKDSEIELLKSIKDSAHTTLAYQLNELILERLSEKNADILITDGFSPHQDSTTGETLWRKSA